MRKTSILFVCMIALVAFAAWAPNANSFESYFSDANQGNCTACHPTTSVPVSCAACHAHGVYLNSAKNDINVFAMTDLLTYAPGETVTVSISGGYRDGWVRTILYDENNVEVDRSTGPAGLGGGPEFFGPIDLTAPAPTTPGTYTWTASWYGNEFRNGATSSTYVPDPSNSGHGEEMVETNSFVVVAASEPCEGDFDGDGDVDGSDLAVLSADFGRTDCGVPTTCPADFNNDGDVDGSDLAIFAADFGRTDCP